MYYSDSDANSTIEVWDEDIDNLTFQVIGCAMKVHNVLGNGFQEVIYQRALAIELEACMISFEREKEQEVYYLDSLVGVRRADFIVNEELVVELKAVIRLEDVHLAQAKNYTVAYGFANGLLINFGSNRLEFKRVFNQHLNP